MGENFVQDQLSDLVHGILGSLGSFTLYDQVNEEIYV
jgi:hypothetical protein